MRNLGRLFLELFCIALFVVGGGYAIIAVAEDVFAKKLKWIKEGELMDELPLFQMIPGIMAAHASVYLGRKAHGFAGSCVGLVAIALPSVIIFTAVSMGYDAIPLDNPWLGAVFEGLRAALTGVILAMTVKSVPRSIRSWKDALGFALALGLLFVPGMPVILVILAAILFGLAKGALKSGSLVCASWIGLAPLVFLKYGFVAFGGGHVLVPLYIQDFVGPAAAYLQIPSEEFANLMALTQMTPGPIGINAATFFGYRLFGFGGSLVTTACLLLPGFFILSFALRSLEKFKDSPYVQGVLSAVKPVTLAMMTAALWSFAGMSLWTSGAEGTLFHPFSFLLVAGSAALVFWRVLGAVKVILLSAAISVLRTLLVYLIF